MGTTIIYLLMGKLGGAEDAATTAFGCFHALQCYVPGVGDQQSYVPGVEAKQTYVPGIDDKQKSC